MKFTQSLQALFPQLSLEWDTEKNKGLTPDMVAAHSHRRVWWRCPEGHSWQASIASRVSGCGCLVCANRVILAGYNDLATTHPHLAAQWHPTLNGELTPQQVTAGSSRRVWWLCPEGHVWRTAVYNRAGRNKQTGCPVCAGNYKVRYRQRQYKEMMPNGKITAATCRRTKIPEKIGGNEAT